MEEEKLPCGYDRETFERVWRRVMPEDRPDCPFVLEESIPQAPAPQSTALVPTAQAAPMPIIRREPEPCFENDVPCLGSASAVYGAFLQQCIDHELADWRTYYALSRRGQGGGGKVLSTLAADERRHAKRLSTAYFLISGVRYWPADRTCAPPTGAYPAILRQRFVEEQRGEAAYLAAAEETTDPCLRELYLELAGDESSHAWLLRGVLEQM